MKIYIPGYSVEGVSLTNLGFIPFLKGEHEIVDKISEDCDLIFSMSTYMFQGIKKLSEEYKVPVISYVWDFYQWAYDGKHSWPHWHEYAEWLRTNLMVITPSEAQRLRLRELTGIDAQVVRTGHDCFEAETSDERFVLDHMRFYPEENERWVITACDTQYIHYIHPEHSLEREDIEKAIANCTFLACGYKEASTGGLTILEGLWLGKPVLLSDSPYQGGREYAGEFGTYFKHDDYNDLKLKLKEMFENPPKIDIIKAREYIKENFSYEVMAKNLSEKFKSALSK